MHRIFALLIFVCAYFAAFGQKIFSVDRQYQADLKVFFTDKE